MEAAQVVALRLPRSAGRSVVEIEEDTIVINQLRLTDRALATFVQQRPADDRPELAERALRIGLHALQDAGTSIDVDFVRREFEALLERSATVNERAARELDNLLRANFGDQDGRLPRTLEKFLGDRGQLNRLVSELFDETKRDSAIGRMRTLLGAYFDGDASRLAQLIDPTRLGSPMYQFRTEITRSFEMLNERLTAIEAADAARTAERARSAAKGTDFEDLLEEMLVDAVRGSGDVVERTGTVAGDVIRSRKGDFLLTVDPLLCHGAELRVVIEAKNRSRSWREMREELEDAKRNRGAALAVAAFTPEHAPTGIAPFDMRFGHLFCVVDPDAPDAATVAAVVKLARLLALASLSLDDSAIDAARLAQTLAGVKTELEVVRRLKVQLTSIRGTAAEVATGLDRMREQILAKVADAEAQLLTGADPG